MAVRYREPRCFMWHLIRYNCMNKKNNKSQRQNKNKMNKILKMEGQILALERNILKKSSAPKKPRAMTHLTKLHPIAQKYFAALTAPHLESVRGCYTPDMLARPSQKVTVRGKFTLTLPASSRGMFFINPSAANDRASMFGVTGATSAFPNGKFTGSGSGLNYGYDTKLSTPYSYTEMQDAGTSYRGTSFGLRARYTGPALSRGGTLTWLHDTTSSGHSILTDAERLTVTLDDLTTRVKADPRARICSFNKCDAHEFVVYETNSKAWWNPATGADAYPFAGNTADNKLGLGNTEYWGMPEFPAILIIENPNTTSIEVTIDFILHMEFSGPKVIPYQTASPPALQDCHIVHTAVEQSNNTHAQVPDVHPAEHAEGVLGAMVAQTSKFGGEVMRELGHIAFGDHPAETLAKGLASLFL